MPALEVVFQDVKLREIDEVVCIGDLLERVQNLLKSLHLFKKTVMLSLSETVMNFFCPHFDKWTMFWLLC